MAFIQMNIFSDSIGIATPVNIIMPENSKEPPAVLYLLHGLSDDHSMWTRRTSIERYAESRNLAVIMPTTYRGYYTDMENGYNYWTYIAEELPKSFIQCLTFPKNAIKLLPQAFLWAVTALSSSAFVSPKDLKPLQRFRLRLI